MAVLNNQYVKRIKAPEKGVYRESCDKVRGLYAWVYPSGRRCFYFRQGAEWTYLGDFDDSRNSRTRFTTADAHETAADLRKRMRRGENLKAKTEAEKKAAGTLAAVVDEYRQHCEQTGQRSIREKLRTYSHDIAPTLGTRPLKSITRSDLIKMRDRIVRAGNPRQANLALVFMGALYRWAIDKEIADDNPRLGIKPANQNGPRNRVLRVHELRTILEKLPDSGLSTTMQDIIRVIVYTGQRRGEVCGMQWKEIDDHDMLWNLPAERSKNGRRCVTPITDKTLSIIRCQPYLNEYVFASVKMPDKPIFADAVSRAILRKQDYFGLEPWTAHDLRRSVATGMLEYIKTSPAVVEAMLNHTPDKLTRTYQAYSYLDEQRDALAQWGRLVDADNVVEIAAG